MKRAGERLDQFSQIVTRGGGLTADEAEQAAASPFLYTRVRARIESERKSRATPFADRFAMLPVAWRAIAALLIITLAAGAAFYASRRAATPNRSGSPGNTDVSRVIAGGTCALSATDQCAISTEEVLATLFAETGGEQR